MILILKITIRSELYPSQLRNIKNPPKQLYLNGNIRLLSKPLFSIVGSRHGTENGIKHAKRFASELSMQGLVIVSGLARGIDSAAHLGTIEAGGKTIAVLGNGFNNIYPKENIELYENIIKNDGLIISEYPPNTEPASHLFLERNRIVSGISIGILVIEASYRSGTSVTAGLANKQGRKVFVLPHDIENKYGVGTNNLIKKGASLVTSTKEIIKQFDFLTYRDTKKIDIIDINKEKNFKSKDHREVYELINNGIKEVDKIAKKSNKSISDISNILFMLEMQGYIRKIVGGYICI